MQMRNLIKTKSEFLTDLNRSEVLVKLRVQWRQLIYGAVESAVVVTQDLAQEEGGKRYIYDNSLFKQDTQLHAGDEFKHWVDWSRFLWVHRSTS